jgi:hypothetical protein
LQELVTYRLYVPSACILTVDTFTEDDHLLVPSSKMLVEVVRFDPHFDKDFDRKKPPLQPPNQGVSNAFETFYSQLN